MNSNQFLQEPHVVIKKDRIQDINIRAAHRKLFTPECQLKSDLRISCNTEVPVQWNPNQPVKSERIKERTSFKFQWL